MSNFKFPGLKASVDAEFNMAKMRQEAKTDTIDKEMRIMLNHSATGDLNGTKVLVATPEYKQWLTALQEQNPFIGKDYVQRAHEYEHDDEEVDAQSVMPEAEMVAITEVGDDGKVHISDEYNPNIDDYEVDFDDTARKFNDMAIIRNTTDACIGWDFDAVMEKVEAAFLDEYGEDFELPKNLEDTVKASLEASEMRAQITYGGTDADSKQ